MCGADRRRLGACRSTRRSNAALDGNIAAFDAAFSRQAAAGGQTYPVLSAAMRLMQSLHMMRGVMEKERKPAAAMVASAPARRSSTSARRL